MYKHLDDLVYWIDEREKVRCAKESGLPAPWSNDWVFQETYFCNVHREDDRVTKWIRTNWKPWVGHEDMHVTAMALARFVNKPTTLEVLGYPIDGITQEYLHHWYHTFNNLDIPWGNAYLVSTNGKKMGKPVYIAGVLRSVQEASARYNYDSLASTYEDLIKIDGIGSFMAGQIIADLKNTEGHPLEIATDWDTWVAHGPGSLRGMTWVLDYGKITPTLFYRYFPKLHKDILKLGFDIHAQDLQNCLCEFDKYMRVKTNTGRSKRKYNGKNS